MGGAETWLLELSRLIKKNSDYSGRIQFDYLLVGGSPADLLTNDILSTGSQIHYLNFNLGSFFKINNFKPEFVIGNNILFGTLKNPNSHQFIDFKIPNKGLYETGLHLNNIITFNGGGYGISVFYRYGPYASPVFKNNISLKLTLSLLMQ